MKFRGTAQYQTKMIFEMSGILMFGKSKHDAKSRARAEGAKGPTAVALKTGLFALNSYRAYFRTCLELLQFASKMHGIKKANQLTPDHVRSFLLGKSNVKLSTFRRYTSALTKTDSALSKLLDRPPQWTAILKEFRDAAPIALDGEQPARAYRHPHALVDQLKGDLRLVAEMMLMAGLRVSEACKIKQHQLKGTTSNEEGETIGLIEVKGKGGKVRTIPVPLGTYMDLADRLKAEAFVIEPTIYRKALRRAAHETGQEYKAHGTHGLRWNYCQELMSKELLHRNVAYEVALTKISKLMGHERASITTLYLRKA